MDSQWHTRACAHTNVHAYSKTFRRQRRAQGCLSDEGIIQNSDLYMGVIREFLEEAVNLRALNRKVSNFHTVESGRAAQVKTGQRKLPVVIITGSCSDAHHTQIKRASLKSMSID